MDFVFNLQNLLSISVGFSFQFVLLSSIFIFYKSGSNRLYNLLAWVLLFWSFVGLRNIILLTLNMDFFSWAEDITYIIEMLTVPITVAFLIELVCPKSISLKNLFFVLLPYILLLFLLLFLPSYNIIIMMFCTSLVYAVISFFATTITIPRYKNWLKNNFSDTENLKTHWMWLILLMFCVMFSIWIWSVLNFGLVLEIVFNFFKPICWGIVFYFIYRQQKEIDYVGEHNTLNDVEGAEIEEDDNGLAANDDSNLKNHFIGFDLRLEKSFVEPKLFLNKTLTMAELALELNTNRTYLSYYFNKVLHVTFYDYVNEYRLDYASQMLITNPEMSIEEVGEVSGFNSLSTFRRSFNKYFGCNPKDYRKSNGFK